jgi:hypothetical protein
VRYSYVIYTIFHLSTIHPPHSAINNRLVDGQRAWQKIYYDYDNDKSMKDMVVLTVKDGEQYQLVFSAQPGEFNRYLPIAEKMIKSFQ